MNVRDFWALICISACCFLASCTRNVKGGNPTIPLATSNGTSHLFNADVGHIQRALTNAFDLGKYHSMLLLDVTNSDWDYLAPNWHPTNGYILYESRPVTNVPLTTGISVPYLPIFYVQVQSQGDGDETKVTVRTMHSEVIDGEETGVHGGWANHTREIAPVRQAEEDVIAAVEKELLSLPKQN